MALSPHQLINQVGDGGTIRNEAASADFGESNAAVDAAIAAADTRADVILKVPNMAYPGTHAATPGQPVGGPSNAA